MEFIMYVLYVWKNMNFYGVTIDWIDYRLFKVSINVILLDLMALISFAYFLCLYIYIYIYIKYILNIIILYCIDIM